MSTGSTGGRSQPSKQGQTGRTRRRGVENLTSEQLLKKRASDREAQRVVRRRTRNQIEALQQRIREFEEQQPYQDLERALQENERIRGQNARFREQLSRVLAIVRPTHQDNEDQTLHSLSQRSPDSLPRVRQSSYDHVTEADDACQAPENNLDPIASPRFHGHGQARRVRASSEAIHATSTAPAPIIVAPQNALQWHSAATTSSDSSQEFPTFQNVAEPGGSLEKLQNRTFSGGRLDNDVYQANQRVNADARRLSPRLSISAKSTARSNIGSVSSAGHSAVPPSPKTKEASPQISPQLVHRATSYKALTLNIPPTCLLDNILQEFLAERRNQAAEGLPLDIVLGPPSLNVSALIYPERSIYSHPLSKIFTDLIGAFPNVQSLAEKIAICYVMFLKMRWRIHPSQENYNRVPEWLVPSSIQLLIPHPAWIDYLAWPVLREKLVRSYGDYPYADFFIPCAAEMCVNWPYNPADCLLRVGGRESDIINPVFEEHIRNLDNWTLGSEFGKRFPELMDAVTTGIG